MHSEPENQALILDKGKVDITLLVENANDVGEFYRAVGSSGTGEDVAKSVVTYLERLKIEKEKK